MRQTAGWLSTPPRQECSYTQVMARPRLELAREQLNRVQVAAIDPVDWSDLCIYGFHAVENAVVVRPESWTRPAGVSPARVIAGEPGSRPRFVAERRRAERGVKSLLGGSKRAGRSATRRESCSLVTFTTGEPSRSRHGEGPRPTAWQGPEMPQVGSSRGMGSGTYARSGSEGERPVCAASSAKTARISQW